MASRLSLRAVVAAAALLLVAGCGSSTTGDNATPPAHSAKPHQAAASSTGMAMPPVKQVKPEPLRRGETRLALKIPRPFTPAAPHGVGTDDYRCFLLDPHLTSDRFLTGTFVRPADAAIVHHVILYRVDPDQVAAAKQLDARDPGEGWTCFGDSGLPNSNSLDNAPWLGAWAPGATESVDAPGYGVPMPRGSQIVMQVHYNLLAGTGTDQSSALLRMAPPGAHLTPLETMLIPAPVELGCRPGHRSNPLCNRTASIADVVRRFGPVGQTDNWLHVLCGGRLAPSQVTSCTRTVTEPTTIRSVAGHMHLLGRSIKIVVNPGTPRAKTVLDIPVWNFDHQEAHAIKPVPLHPGDTVKVTCRHVQWLRDKLPAFAGQPDRYVVWGEGSTDEMCLGILSVTHP